MDSDRGTCSADDSVVARVVGVAEGASEGNGGALFVGGPARTGKTRLLEAAFAALEGMMVFQVDGYEVESRMPAAGISRLDGHVSHPSTGVLAHIDVDDPLRTGLTMLARLRDLASEQPVVLLGDDAHWLDPFTLDVLGIVGRRITRDRIALILAGEHSDDLTRRLVGIDCITLHATGEEAPRNTGDSQTHLAEIRLLGGFAIEVMGVPIVLGEGAAATLLKVVALKGHVPAEEVEEILWPGAEPGVGRTRMRNVLHRIRNACGPVVEREGRSIRLAAGVRVDAHVFEERALKAIAALDSDESGARAAAWDALTLYRGELLPVDRHADWTFSARERVGRLYFSLFDHLELDASSRGDRAEALRIIERAIKLDPYDEARYIRGARLLAERGSTGPATSMLRSAQVSMEELGVGPSQGLSALLKRLSG